MKSQIVLSLAVSVMASVAAHADSTGQSSNTNYIQVGGTEWVNGSDANGHTGEPGSPGIGVHTSETPFKRVSLSRLEWLARFGLGGSHNIFTGLTELQEDHWAMPTSHSDFGHYAFSSVDTDDKLFGNKLYFGEWSDEGDFTDNTHTVFYVGKDKTTDMPSTGTATYDVKGINNSGDNGYLNGTLTADFSNNNIGGVLSNDNLTLSINNNTIDPSTASFSGVAMANGTNGTSQGEFFGNEALALGGIATFTDKSLDTAFAGTRGDANN